MGNCQLATALLLLMCLALAIVGIWQNRHTIKCKLNNQVSYNPGSYTCPTKFWEETVIFHERQDALTPAGQILFFGDSLVQGMGVNAISTQAINYGIGSDTTSGMLNRLPRYTSTTTAKAIVLLLGVNDMKVVSDATILENYTQILEHFDSTPVLCIGVLPIDSAVRENWQDRSNSRITAFNNQLSQLCGSSPRAYLSVEKELADGNRNLKKEFHIGDGLHLSDAGNQILANSIANVLKEMNLLP